MPNFPEIPDLNAYMTKISAERAEMEQGTFDEQNPTSTDPAVFQIQRNLPFNMADRESRMLANRHELRRICSLYFPERDDSETAEATPNPLQHATEEFKAQWRRFSSDMFVSLESPEADVDVSEEFMKELIARWLPRCSSYDSWIGEDAIQAICRDNGILIERVHSMTELAGQTDRWADGHPDTIFPRVELGKLGPLVYIPEPEDPPLHDTFKTNLRLSLADISKYLVSMEKWIWRWLIEYVAGDYLSTIMTEREQGREHYVLSEEMLEAYCRRVLGYQWFEGCFEDVEFDRLADLVE